MKVNASPVIFREKSQNSKISTDSSVNTTWVSQHSCPTECPLKDKGCYAQLGYAGMITARLNRNETSDHIEIANAEAKSIKESEATRPLRLHSVGDCKTDKAAYIVSEACKEYTQKHGQKVWTYTHSKNVRRSSWQNVSVLSSCENMTQVKKQHKKGFATALIVHNFEKQTTYDLGEGFKGIPCPQQTGKAKDCKSCQLCWNDTKLHAAKRVILFVPHGVLASTVAKQLG